MKTAIYTRISTDKQVHDSKLVELREYTHRRGWKNTVEYSDTVSGSKFTRRGLDALLIEVRKGGSNGLLFSSWIGWGAPFRTWPRSWPSLLTKRRP